MNVRVSRPVGFVLVSYAFLVTMLGTSLPTPLYPLLQARYGVGELQVTVIFAVYSFGVVAALLALGNLSDAIGRRALLLLALGLSALSAVLFLSASSLVPIYIGRVLSGLSAGLFTGTGTAYLVDLAPDDRRRFASLIAVVVNLGGLGTGTLLSGVLAEYVRNPLRVPFIADLVLLVPAAAGVFLAPETVVRRRSRGLRLQRLRIPREVRGVFLRAATAGGSSFSVAAVISSVAPAYLARDLGRPNHALAGVLFFVLMAASIVGQLAVPRLSERRALLCGCTILLAGIAFFAAGVGAKGLALLFAGAVIVGLGQGVVIGAGLTAINRRAPVEQRSETASSFFVVMYIGLSVPVIGVGLLADVVSLKSAALVFSAAVAGVVGIVLASQVRPARNSEQVPGT